VRHRQLGGIKTLEKLSELAPNGVDKRNTLWYNDNMKERKQYDHKCDVCGKPMKSNEAPHPSLKVSHGQCAMNEAKPRREKLKKSGV
jgi:hypothetical protein